MKLRSLARRAAGWVLIVLGVLGVLLPIVPGIPLLLAGLALLSWQRGYPPRILEAIRRWTGGHLRLAPRLDVKGTRAAEGARDKNASVAVQEGPQSSTPSEDRDAK